MNLAALDQNEVQSFWDASLPSSARVRRLDEVLSQGWLRGEDHSEVSLYPGAVFPEMAKFLYYVVRHLRPALVVETGFGFGISAMAVVAALEENQAGQHFSIDPTFRQWTKNAGLLELERWKSERVFVMETGSQWALPHLHQKQLLSSLGLAVIDGCHLFELTLLDFFYLDLALPVGGWIIVDDPASPAVSTMLSFVAENRAYTVFQSTAFGCALLRKEGEDQRSWDHFSPFSISPLHHWGTQPTRPVKKD